ELAVTGLRLVAVEQGRVIAAAKSGKVKTASTMVCICLMLLLSNAATLRLVCVWIILLTTIYSGVEYFIKNRDVLANGEM
ncbi:MAG: CDP-diacylglycerol--glycerol-3-phosphate 3-phosphatidyltransferase, partial [Bacillota bacterium]|nr:CDP-diacylglycerol--glycerol-3-phosphate 3-phosphatidyltransferase [Bacillota bacterium]